TAPGSRQFVGFETDAPNMWGLSAYFARTQMSRQVVTQTPLVVKFIVTDRATGDYTLNTTSGNRVPRQPINGVSKITPHNPFVAHGQAGRGVVSVIQMS